MRVLSKAAFAREAGVTPSAISRASNTILQTALTEGGIDADHPAAIEYLSRCGQTGRPRGGSDREIADFVVANSRQLKRLELTLDGAEEQLVKHIGDNLYYLGFMARRLRTSERFERMRFVSEGLAYLRDIAA